MLVARAGTFIADFARYNPVTDGAGGWPWKNVAQGTSGVTRPGSHYQNLKDLQDSIKKKLQEYEENCRDGDGPTPPCVKEASEKPIPVPISPPTDFETQRMIDAGNYGATGWGAVALAGTMGIDLITGGGAAPATVPVLRLVFAF